MNTRLHKRNIKSKVLKLISVDKRYNKMADGRVSRVAFLKASVYGCVRLFPTRCLRDRKNVMGIVPRRASCQGDVPLRVRCANLRRRGCSNLRIFVLLHEVLWFNVVTLFKWTLMFYRWFSLRCWDYQFIGCLIYENIVVILPFTR